VVLGIIGFYIVVQLAWKKRILRFANMELLDGPRRVLRPDVLQTGPRGNSDLGATKKMASTADRQHVLREQRWRHDRLMQQPAPA
jgi:hypothetical protein